jgi:hypothetical protein
MENWSEWEEACNVYMEWVLNYAELLALQYNLIIIEGFWKIAYTRKHFNKYLVEGAIKKNFRRLLVYNSNLPVRHVVDCGRCSELLMYLV